VLLDHLELRSRRLTPPSRFYGVDVWRTALFTEVRLVEKSFTMCFQNGSAF
jgi:hypothetical protein